VILEDARVDFLSVDEHAVTRLGQHVGKLVVAVEFVLGVNKLLLFESEPILVGGQVEEKDLREGWKSKEMKKLEKPEFENPKFRLMVGHHQRIALFQCPCEEPTGFLQEKTTTPRNCDLR
jgi:hypothetical protein